MLQFKEYIDPGYCIFLLGVLWFIAADYQMILAYCSVKRGAYFPLGAAALVIAGLIIFNAALDGNRANTTGGLMMHYLLLLTIAADLLVILNYLLPTSYRPHLNFAFTALVLLAAWATEWPEWIQIFFGIVLVLMLAVFIVFSGFILSGEEDKKGMTAYFRKVYPEDCSLEGIPLEDLSREETDALIERLCSFNKDR